MNNQATFRGALWQCVQSVEQGGDFGKNDLVDVFEDLHEELYAQHRDRLARIGLKAEFSKILKKCVQVSYQCALPFEPGEVTRGWKGAGRIVRLVRDENGKLVWRWIALAKATRADYRDFIRMLANSSTKDTQSLRNNRRLLRHIEEIMAGMPEEAVIGTVLVMDQQRAAA